MTTAAVISGGGTLTVGAPVPGVAGTGTLYLSGANIFSGNIVVNSGTLQGIAIASGTGSPFGIVGNNVASYGGTFNLTGIASSTTTTIGTLSVNGGGTLLVNDATTTVFTTLGLSNITRNPGGTLVINPDQGKLSTGENIVFATAPATINGIMRPTSWPRPATPTAPATSSRWPPATR